MLRRDFVRSAAAVFFAPKLLLPQQAAKPAMPAPAPVPWTLGLNPLTPRPHTETPDGIAETDPRFFTATQLATLTRLCDLLLPPIGTMPGAVEAETPQFLDFLIGQSPARRQTLYAGGLDWLDAEAQKSAGKPFAQLDAAQAGAQIKPWLRTWMSDHPPTEPHAGFVNIAHDDIRMATANSRPRHQSSAAPNSSANTTLYWYPIEPDLHSPGETQLPAHTAGGPNPANVMPTYAR